MCESNHAMTCWLDFMEASPTPCGRLSVVAKVGCTLSSQKTRSSWRNRHLLAELPFRSSTESAAAKQTVATFVAKVGHVITVTLVAQRTGMLCVDHCLPQVLDAMAPRPRTLHRGILLHHHNATAHKAKQTRDFLAQEWLQQLRHPPYSPSSLRATFSSSLRQRSCVVSSFSQRKQQ